MEDFIAYRQTAIHKPMLSAFCSLWETPDSDTSIGVCTTFCALQTGGTTPDERKVRFPGQREGRGHNEQKVAIWNKAEAGANIELHPLLFWYGEKKFDG